MYSAIKHDGKPLYFYARKGLDVPRKAREITVRAIELESFHDDQVTIRVCCSKGTYIRTLAEDIGQKLGCGGYLKALERVAVSGFNLAEAYSFSNLESMSAEERDARLLPQDLAARDLLPIRLPNPALQRLCNGLVVETGEQDINGPVRLYDAENKFWGIGEIDEKGWVTPVRLIAHTQSDKTNLPESREKVAII